MLNMKNLSPKGTTKFCFLFGKEIQNSLSPGLHSGWFQRYGLNTFYLPCQVQSEEIFKSLLFSLLETDNFLGANITMPFKNSLSNSSKLILSDTVKTSGSSNTVYKNSQNQWTLENTDIYGIEKTILSLIPEKTNYQMVILGGGGAAASCAYYGEHLSLYCQKILCLTNTPEKSYAKFPVFRDSKKCKMFSYKNHNYTEILTYIENYPCIIVNCTPPNSNFEQNKNNIFISLIKKITAELTYVFDTNYSINKASMSLNKHHFCNGLLMLEEQAKKSFFLWTGKKP